MNVLFYILRRLLFIVPVMLGVVTLIFILCRVVPADPIALAVGDLASEAERQAAISKFGLDKPLYIQYINYVSGVFFRADFGTSIYTKRPVLAEILQYLPASLELIFSAYVIVILLGIFIGVLSATHKDKFLDHALRILSLGGVAVPGFWFAIVAQLIFSYTLGIFPVGGRIDIFSAPQHITGLFIVDSMVTGNIGALLSTLSHLILPATILGYESMGMISRLTRSEMLEVLEKDYVKASRSYGFSERRINYRYALRNALVPIVTRIGLSFIAAFGSTVVIETVFSYPGVGLYLTNAILFFDYQAILGATIFISILALITNLVVDIIYFYVTPQIRLGGTK